MSAAINEEDEDEENFFQAFAHRVKNTWDTTSTPQWFQGEPFRLPRWMTGNENGGNNGNGVTTGLLSGRPNNGNVRL